MEYVIIGVLVFALLIEIDKKRHYKKRTKELLSGQYYAETIQDALEDEVCELEYDNNILEQDYEILLEKALEQKQQLKDIKKAGMYD